MSAPFRTSRRIEFSDTDMAGIAHFSRFFIFMECAEHEFLRSRGLSVVLEWEGEHLGFPRVRATCDYVKPVRFEEVLTIEVTLRKIGQKSLTYGVDFLQGTDLIARGEITTVCCRVLAGGGIESREIPTGIRERLA